MENAFFTAASQEIPEFFEIIALKGVPEA